MLEEEDVDLIEPAVESEPVPFQVFQAESLAEEIPEGFNAVEIELDASLLSKLEWTSQKSAAASRISKGFKIFWKLNLGLFDGLHYPVGNSMQFQSLCLALEHFRDSIWPMFKDNSLGASLYSGSLDFTQNFQWDSEQEQNWEEWLKEKTCVEKPSKYGRLARLYCGWVTAEYMNLLATRVPDGCRLFALLDANAIADPLERI